MSQIKQITIVLVAVVAIGVLAIVQIQPVRAEGAYSRGSTDAYRDFHHMNGHGFDDSCPAGHSAQYCVNYQNGYSTNWAVVSNDYTINHWDVPNTENGVDSNRVDNAQTGAIGGNTVHTGDHSDVTINQLLNQRQDSPQADSSTNADNADNNGVNPNCKAFCVN